MDKNNSQKIPPEINEKYQKWKLYGKDSLEVRKDFTERMLKFSEEYRRWIVQLATVGAAVIGAVVAIARVEVSQNYLLLISLILLTICIIWGLLHVKNSIEKQMIYLQQEHDKFQQMIDRIRSVYLEYFNDPSSGNKLKIIKQEKIEIDALKEKPEISLARDKTVQFIFCLFATSLFLMIISVINLDAIKDLISRVENKEIVSAFVSLSVAIFILIASFFQWWDITYNGGMITKRWIKVFFIISIILLLIALILIII